MKVPQIFKDVINGWTVTREVQPYVIADSSAQITYIVYKKDTTLTPLVTKQIVKSIKQLP